MGHSDIDITIYLVDSETGQVKASKKVLSLDGLRKLINSSDVEAIK